MGDNVRDYGVVGQFEARLPWWNGVLLEQVPAVLLPEGVADDNPAEPITSHGAWVAVLQGFELGSVPPFEHLIARVHMDIVDVSGALGIGRDRVHQPGAEQVTYLNACVIRALAKDWHLMKVRERVAGRAELLGEDAE